MIEKIRLRKKKNEVVKVGDVVNYRGSMFIILNVLAVRVMINRKNGELITMSDCLGQQYRTPDLSSDYITTQAEITYEPEEFRLLVNISMIKRLEFGFKLKQYWAITLKEETWWSSMNLNR